MTKPRRKPSSGPARNGRAYVLVGLVALAAAICFFPLIDYFFLQDDFILLEDAAFRPNTAFSAVFDSTPGLFRPLTKVAYFAVMYPIFGLNPVPYHFVSLLLHVINICLLFWLFRQFKVETTSTLVVTALFALNVAYLDVLGWICCVQQLAAMLFMLLGLNLGLRSIETRSLVFTVAAAASYVLALLCAEQTYALPLILFLYAYQREKAENTGERIRRAGAAAAIPIGVMVVYLVFMIGWKGIPGAGPYMFHLGANVGANLLTYLDWVFDLSVVMPFVTNVGSPGLTVSHLVILGLVVYNLAKGRTQIVLFSLAAYLLTLLPVLFLEQHAFYIHNYIPSFAMFLLLAPAVQDFFGLIRAWHPKFSEVFAVSVVLLVAVMCFTKIRTNETNFLREDILLPKNFVLRRAVIAKNAYDDIRTKTDTRRRPKQLFMIYKDRSGWYKDNVIAALGKSSAPRLFYSAPDLAVYFHDHGDTLTTYDPTNSVMLFFDHTGHCFTTDEVRRDGGDAMQILEPE